MDNDKIKLKNRALLKFSKEALAYYVETSRLLSPMERVFADLKSIDDYFRSSKALETLNRIDAINNTLKTKISKKQRLELLKELRQCYRRVGIKV